MEEPKQLRFFNPDNPPLAFSKEEGNAKLDQLKQQMRQAQLDRANAHNVKKHSNA